MLSQSYTASTDHESWQDAQATLSRWVCVANWTAVWYQKLDAQFVEQCVRETHAIDEETHGDYTTTANTNLFGSRNTSMTSGFKADLTGSFSTPCDDNPTVVMVEAAYRHHNMNWRYINAEVPPDGLASAVAGARAMGWRGFNLSMPHKVSIIPLLDGLGESAQLINAVNCVVRVNDQLIGENTDGKGFLSSLTPIHEPKGSHVMLLGAGGAARAIAVELILAGIADLTIVNRSLNRANELRDIAESAGNASIRIMEWKEQISVPDDVHVLVNCTSIGLGDAEATIPVASSSLRKDLIVADVIPNPPKTHFLKTAQEAGCRTIDGLGMLVGQGVLGIRYWSQMDVAPDIMRQALVDVFS